MKETLQDLKSRRSVRKYLPKQITDEELNIVLEAGTYAPTAVNMQSPIMVVVQEPELIKKLSAMNAAVMGKEGIDPFYGAPTVVIVLAEKGKGCPVQDGSLVMGNLMNAAHAIGLASCWINRAYEVFSTEEGKALLADWGIVGEYIGVGHCILGYADGPLPEAKPRKENYIIKL